MDDIAVAGAGAFIGGGTVAGVTGSPFQQAASPMLSG